MSRPKLTYPDLHRVLHGTLEMERKIARDVMKPLAEVKMKSLDSRMNFHSWTEISDWGYSRIPIYKSLDNGQDTDTTYSDFNIKIIGFLHVFVSLNYGTFGSPLDVFVRVGFDICDYR